MTTELVQYQPQSDLSEQMRYAEVVSNGSLLPTAYRGKPADILIAIGLGQAMGLSHAESLYRIDVIQGKPTAAAELIASNVRKAGHKLRVTVDEQNVTATASIWRSDDPEFEHTVTRDTVWAKRMGLESKDNYKKQAATMLSWRAITAVARLACPEALYGVVYTPDEIGDAPPVRETQRASSGDFLKAEKVEPAADEITGEVIEPDPITTAQSKMLHASMNDAGITARQARLDYCRNLIGRDITSSSDLTKAEASQVIDALQADLENTEPPADEAGA